MLLSNLHHSAKRLLAWVILPLISVSFVFFGIQSYLHIYSDDNHAATVNGVTISQRQVDTAYERARAQLAQQNQQQHLSPSVEKQLKTQARERLVMQELLKQAAMDMGYRVSLPVAQAALMQMPAFQEDGKFSETVFAQVLSSNMYTPKTFIKDLQTNMLISQLQSGIVRSSFALPPEVERSINLLEQKRDIRYLLIPVSAFQQEVKVSNEAMKQYYETHQVQFKTPERVSVSYIKLSLPEMMKQIQVSDADAQAYYNDYKDNYRSIPEYRVAHILIKLPKQASEKDVKTAQAKLEDIRTRLQKGESFSKLAQSLSDDKLSAKKKGELPWFKPGTFDPNFERSAMRLTKVGEVSEPVRTQYGYSLIRLLELKPSKIIPFAKVKESIRKTMIQDKAQKQFAHANDVLASETFSSPDSLEPAASALKLKVNSSPLFDRSGSKEGLSANAKVRAAAFSDDVLAGNNSDVIQVDAESVMVLRVKTHKAASVKPFKAVKAQIHARLRKEAAILKARNYAEKVMVAIEKHKDVAALLESHKLNWQTARAVSRQDSKLNALILKTAFDIAPPTKGLKQPTKMVTLDWGDVALIQLNKIIANDSKKLTAKQREDFASNMAYTQGLLEYELYVKGLEAKAKIERHQ